MHGRFLWADLSTFRLKETQRFYAQVMGWCIGNYTASTQRGPVAGIYEMPEEFQQIGMPSFWMSYIAVTDIVATVEDAKALGGKVELGPSPFEGGGTYALIRDPLGAGFTVYQGTTLDGADDQVKRGHGLFVSDANAVRGFYTSLFGWQFGSSYGGVQSIRLADKTIGHLHEIQDPAIRGDEQYWAVLFVVEDLTLASQHVLSAGGGILAETHLPEGAALLAHDPDGGTFFLVSPS